MESDVVVQGVAAPHVITLKQALDLAAVAIKRGDIALGRARLDWILERDPDNPLAWLWLSRCTDARDEQAMCFYRVLSVDPTNRYALEGLKTLREPVPVGALGSGHPDAIAAPTPSMPVIGAPRKPTPRAALPYVAGASTRRMARQRRTRAILFAVGGLAGVALLGVAIQNGSALGSGGLLVLYALLLTLPRLLEKSLDRRMKRVDDAVRGAEGEEQVGRILENLGESYLTLHDVESPFGNIDHIVISRQGGIFLLETKAHRGRVDVIDGRLLLNQRRPEKDFISQVLRNTYWLRDQAAPAVGDQPWITALLVFTNAFVPRAAPIKGVRILNKRFLLEALQENGSHSGLNERIWEERGEIQRALDGSER